MSVSLVANPIDWPATVLSISGDQIIWQNIARFQTHIWLVSVCCVLFVRIIVDFVFKYISLFS